MVRASVFRAADRALYGYFVSRTSELGTSTVKVGHVGVSGDELLRLLAAGRGSLF